MHRSQTSADGDTFSSEPISSTLSRRCRCLPAAYSATSSDEECSAERFVVIDVVADAREREVGRKTEATVETEGVASLISAPSVISAPIVSGRDGQLLSCVDIGPVDVESHAGH